MIFNLLNAILSLTMFILWSRSSDKLEQFKIEYQRIIAETIDDQPNEIDRQLNEALIKAGRRCAHDLAHSISFIADEQWSKFYEKRSKMWQDLFYRTNGMKDYKNSMLKEIEQLESVIDRLYKILDESGISDPKDQRLPF